MAIALHLALAIGIHIIGRFALLPEVFDPNGIGTTFAVDSVSYRNDVIGLTKVLYQEGFWKWLQVEAPFHVELYSLSFALFGPLVGFNTLAAEPLNILYYLLILFLVYLLGREAFGERVGLFTAAIVALWPSLLLHTTQLLRDPLFIAAMLTLVLMGSTWLTRTCSWTLGIVWGAVGGIACIVLWLIRGDIWEVVVAIVFLECGFLIVRQLRERKLLTWNMVSAALLLAVVLSAPRILETYRQSDQSLSEFLKRAQVTQQSIPGGVEKSEPGAATAGPLRHLWSRLPARIGLLRKTFVMTYPEAGSNLDTDVEINNIKDIAYYLPRAAVIGFFSPFPNMWFVVGAQAGLAGRLLAGLETLIIYVFEFLAVVGLWRARSLVAWLWLVIIALGVIALGLVVVNISTLYRLRYTFWLLLIILGVEGAVRIWSRYTERRSSCD